MGHENRGDADLALDAFQLDLHINAQRLVQRRQGFVQQQNLGIGHHGTGQCDALALTAGQLVWLPIAQIAQLHKLQRLAHAAAFLGGPDLAHPQAKADVVGNAHVRKQRIVLEHHADVALFHRDMFNRCFADTDRAAIGEDEPGDGPQQGGLATSRWAQQRKETAIGEIHGDVVQRFQRPEILADILDRDLGHQRSPPKFENRAAISITAMDTIMMIVEIALISGVNPLRIDV